MFPHFTKTPQVITSSIPQLYHNPYTWRWFRLSSASSNITIYPHSEENDYIPSYHEHCTGQDLKLYRDPRNRWCFQVASVMTESVALLRDLTVEGGLRDPFDADCLFSWNSADSASRNRANLNIPLSYSLSNVYGTRK